MSIPELINERLARYKRTETLLNNIYQEIDEKTASFEKKKMELMFGHIKHHKSQGE
jgi:hypothetical protein